MVIRTGSRGRFIACTGYPKCRKTIPMERLGEVKAGAAARKAAKTGANNREQHNLNLS